MNPIRKHLSYANVVATLALLFAMSGGALAAKHYLVNSASQINPRVLKKLKGHVGKTGRTGPIGPSGPQGLAGVQGSKGADGLSALVPLPSGQSESGDYGIATAGVKNTEIAQGSTFPVPLLAAIPEGQAIYTAETAGSAPHCSGPGHADRGYLCIYSNSANRVKQLSVLNAEQPTLVGGSGRLGFNLIWSVTETGEAFDMGTYTVTAP